MEKIMGIARELSGSLGTQESVTPTPTPAPPMLPSAPADKGSLAGFDPKLLSVMTRIMGEYSSQSGSKQHLAEALKPYLKKERREDLDRAVKIAQLAHIARAALSEFGGDFHL